MSGTVLEARAIITGEDKLSPLLIGLEKRMNALSSAAQNVGRASGIAGVGASVARVARPFSEATRAVNDYSAAMSQASVVMRKIQDAQRNLAPTMQLSSVRAQIAKGAYMASRLSGTAAMMAAPFVATEAKRAASAILSTYREFDKERRFQKAVMGLSDSEQAPLIRQAIHGGATTKFNDIQFLEAQRELAARGLKRDQILGFMTSAADLGQALDLSLPSAVRQMEGAIFGFKKNISTLSDAVAAAKQTADVQVKAAKISGMTPGDIVEVYKYGATPARLAGVSEQGLLAFGAISKKANMGGDEAGVAFRALVSSLANPTGVALTAMRAAHIDYAAFQRAPDHLDIKPFVADIAARYGVRLNDAAQQALAKVFSDKNVIAKPELFSPAVMNVLRDALGGTDAKSLKSIAGEAGRYRNASMHGVDVNGLIFALMAALPGNIQLANAIFGPKQGARIANAFSDPETFRAMLDQLVNHSQDYAATVSKERMAGFDGAMSRFEGAVKNLETAMGRAYDKPLTQGFDIAGKAIQAFTELDDGAHRAAGAMLGVVTAAVSLSGGLKALSAFDRLSGGSGFKAPGVLPLGRKLMTGYTYWNVASYVSDPSQWRQNIDANQAAIRQFEDWGSANLPWWMTNHAGAYLSDWWLQHRSRLGGLRPEFSNDGTRSDFTFGSSGGFSQSGHVMPRSNLGWLGPMNSAPSGAGFDSRGAVTVSGSATVEFSPVRFEAGTELVRIVDQAKAAAAKIPLSPTGHAQSSLGVSMPASQPGSNR